MKSNEIIVAAAISAVVVIAFRVFVRSASSFGVVVFCSLFAHSPPQRCPWRREL